jgi:hypothetical protein
LTETGSASGFRKWIAFGTGVGIEIDGESLRASVVRVRPSGARTVAQHTIANFRETPASEWGAELTTFLAAAGAAGRALMIVLPPADVISRNIAMAGVQKREMAAALAFEMDALAPYGDQEGASGWMLVGDSSALAAITRAETVAHYTGLFAEAGLPVAGFSTSAAVLYASRHIFDPGSREFLALDARETETRIYGESAHVPAYWASVELPPERAVALSRAQMRLSSPEALAEPATLEAGALAAAAAAASACPWLSSSLNLLPSAQRATRSPWMFAPTVALLAMTVLAAIALAGFRHFESERLLGSLNAEIQKAQPAARRATEAERARLAAIARVDQIKSYRDRTRKGLDVLKETTRLIAPPAWANQVDILRNTVNVAGESAAADGLLKVFDASPLFRASEFTSPLSRATTPGMDLFRLRAEREGPAK